MAVRQEPIVTPKNGACAAHIQPQIKPGKQRLASAEAIKGRAKGHEANLAWDPCLCVLNGQRREVHATDACNGRNEPKASCKYRHY